MMSLASCSKLSACRPACKVVSGPRDATTRAAGQACTVTHGQSGCSRPYNVCCTTGHSGALKGPYSCCLTCLFCSGRLSRCKPNEACMHAAQQWP